MAAHLQRRRSRRAAAAAAALLALTLPLTLAARADEGVLEYVVKVTYLYKFAAFVTWPEGALPRDRFTICVMGATPFGDLLDRALQGHTVQARPIALRHIADQAGTAGCQLLYVDGAAAQMTVQILAAVRGRPELTVTDEATDPNQAGIINLVLVEGHVRFAIDNQAAAGNGLIISSKLLHLAVAVHLRTPQ